MDTFKQYIPSELKTFARNALRRARQPRRCVLRSKGYCPCCAAPSVFRAFDPWLRDNYLCIHCGSIPRERALMWTIETFFPGWRDAIIHESSPVGRGASIRLGKAGSHYFGSQYFPGVVGGTLVGGVRCENLEALSFADESIDLHVTQDVFEHIFDPDAAFKEIARTLRPGGAHIFTTPLVRKNETSVRAASLSQGQVVHILAPEFHGNPVSSEGALVTMHWGYDICERIFQATGLFTQLTYIDALELGIRAEYIEVLITRKPKNSPNPKAESAAPAAKMPSAEEVFPAGA